MLALLALIGMATAETLAVPVDTLHVPGFSAVTADSVRLAPRPGSRPGPEVQLGEAYAGWRVTRVSVHGVPGVGGRLRNGLALSGQPKWLILRRRPPFTPQLLASDLDRARLFLARNGYPSATVTPRFETQSKSRALALDLDVVPGPLLRVAENRTEAVPPSLENRARRLLKLKRNEPFSDTKVEHRIARLLSLLQERGRAKARVTTELLPVDSTHVVVLFKVEAGAVYRFSDVAIDGASENLFAAVQRTVGIQPGQTYAPSKLRRAEDGLRALDLFRQVEVTTEDTGDSTVDVVARVAERAPRTLQVGVGYFSDEQAQARVDWKHRNLLGGGRGVLASASGSRFLQKAGVTFWQPALFRSRTRGSVSLNVSRESEELYVLRNAEIEVAATYLQSARNAWRPALTVSRINVESDLPIDSVFDSPPRSLITAGLRWTHSALDNTIDPRRGRYAWSSVEYGMPDFKAAHRYALTEAEGSQFLPTSDRTLIAARAHVGIAFPVGNSLALLPNKRFYGGGASSMRGYRRRKLGPLDQAFRPIGGMALFESSLEFRYPLVGSLRGAVFVDAGQVWERRDDVLNRLAVAAGPGIIMRTPIGLARLDVGMLLTPTAGQPRQVIQLQVGNGF